MAIAVLGEDSPFHTTMQMLQASIIRSQAFFIKQTRRGVHARIALDT
jgi:hypothetical protein